MKLVIDQCLSHRLSKKRKQQIFQYRSMVSNRQEFAEPLEMINTNFGSLSAYLMHNICIPNRYVMKDET